MDLSLELINTFFLWSLSKQIFSILFIHYFFFSFLVTCLVVATELCTEWIAILKNYNYFYFVVIFVNNSSVIVIAIVTVNLVYIVTTIIIMIMIIIIIMITIIPTANANIDQGLTIL